MQRDRRRRGDRLNAAAPRQQLLERLAHSTTRYRWWVIGAWIALTLLGGYAAGQLSNRWFQSLSIPGKSAYEASVRTFDAFDIGLRPPNVVVFHTSGDAAT